jgi:hypothetical protein
MDRNGKTGRGKVADDRFSDPSGAAGDQRCLEIFCHVSPYLAQSPAVRPALRGRPPESGRKVHKRLDPNQTKTGCWRSVLTRVANMQRQFPASFPSMNFPVCGALQPYFGTT